MKNSKNKFYIAIGGLVLIAASSVFILWQILFVQLDETKNEYISARKDLEEIEQKTDLQGELKRELEKAGGDIEVVGSAFLAEEDKLSFIQQLETLAESTQNEYNIGGVREISGARGDVEELEFDITLVGTFQNILTFMRELRSQPYITNISQYSLEPRAENISAQLTFKVYFK